jgi:hypothetical protein
MRSRGLVSGRGPGLRAHHEHPAAQSLPRPSLLSEPLPLSRGWLVGQRPSARLWLAVSAGSRTDRAGPPQGPNPIPTTANPTPRSPQPNPSVAPDIFCYNAPKAGDIWTAHRDADGAQGEQHRSATHRHEGMTGSKRPVEPSWEGWGPNATRPGVYRSRQYHRPVHG